MYATAFASASARALRFFAIALLLALSACSAVRWQKPGADDAALAKDLAACRKQAQDKLGGTGSLAPPASTDPRFGPMGPSQADLRMQEGQALGVCMRARGYVLVEEK